MPVANAPVPALCVPTLYRDDCEHESRPGTVPQPLPRRMRHPDSRAPRNPKSVTRRCRGNSPESANTQAQQGNCIETGSSRQPGPHRRRPPRAAQERSPVGRVELGRCEERTVRQLPGGGKPPDCTQLPAQPEQGRPRTGGVGAAGQCSVV